MWWYVIRDTIVCFTHYDVLHLNNSFLCDTHSSGLLIILFSLGGKRSTVVHSNVPTTVNVLRTTVCTYDVSRHQLFNVRRVPQSRGCSHWSRDISHLPNYSEILWRCPRIVRKVRNVSPRMGSNGPLASFSNTKF